MWSCHILCQVHGVSCSQRGELVSRRWGFQEAGKRPALAPSPSIISGLHVAKNQPTNQTAKISADSRQRLHNGDRNSQTSKVSGAEIAAGTPTRLFVSAVIPGLHHRSQKRQTKHSQDPDSPEWVTLPAGIWWLRTHQNVFFFSVFLFSTFLNKSHFYSSTTLQAFKASKYNCSLVSGKAEHNCK